MNLVDFNEFISICRATVLYDRPPAQFQSISLAKKHDLFYKLSQDYPEFMSGANDQDNEFEATRFTYKDFDGIVHSRPNRPAILVSSTSWTPDEDFSILLKALDRKQSDFLGHRIRILDFLSFA